MLKCFEVNLDKIKNEERFNPKFFNFLKSRDKFLNQNKSLFVNLGDKKFFPIVSDGIHIGVTPINEGEIKYLYVHNLKNGIIDISDNVFISKDDRDKFPNKILKKNTVLLSVVGTVGNTAIFKDYIQYETSLPRNIAYIITNEKLILPEYLTCFFMSYFSKIQTYSSSGGNNQGLISLTKLKKFKVPVIEMKKQEIFAKSLNNMINIEEKFIAGINEIKNEMQKYFKFNDFKNKNLVDFEIDGDLLKKSTIWNANFFNPTWKKIKNKLKENFKIEKLSEHIDAFKGDEIGSDNYEIYTEKETKSLPFIRTSDIYNYQVDIFPDFYCNPQFKKVQESKFENNDLIINNDGKIGYPSILVNNEYIFQSHIRSLKIKQKSSLNQYYIFACLISPFIGNVQFDKNTVIQSTIPTLSNRIYNFEIPIADKNFIKYISDEVIKNFNLLKDKKTILEEIVSKIDSEFNFKDYYN